MPSNLDACMTTRIEVSGAERRCQGVSGDFTVVMRTFATKSFRRELSNRDRIFQEGGEAITSGGRGWSLF